MVPSYKVHVPSHKDEDDYGDYQQTYKYYSSKRYTWKTVHTIF